MWAPCPAVLDKESVAGRAGLKMCILKSVLLTFPYGKWPNNWLDLYVNKNVCVERVRKGEGGEFRGFL